MEVSNDVRCKFEIVIDNYPSWSALAGKKRYVVKDGFGNVACISNIEEYATGFCDALNYRQPNFHQVV